MMDELAKEELDQLMAIYRDQTLQIVDEMSQDLLALESNTADPESMARLRRGAHTIKGDSACVDLNGIATLAHHIEDALDAMIDGAGSLDGKAVDAILKALDAMRAAVGDQETGDVGIETVLNLAQYLAQPGRTHSISEGPSSEISDSIIHSDGKRKKEFVRVEASKIDTLLNLAGEMVIARSVISQLTPELETALPRNETVIRFGGASLQMGKLIADLQKSVLKMRMVTIDHVLRRFARPMRQLARELGKEVELQVSGGETELDRALVDLLYEPILHLLRNAVDHGIETKEERHAAGKPDAGRIEMRAYHEGNQVVVEVSDDGRGIDFDALKTKALESGVISGQRAIAMSEDEAAELIFLEGVSTAKSVTQVSGRGVGASAVKSVAEQMRGSVAVRSEAGRGTTFVLRLPLTLAIIRALLFKAARQLFALPLLAVSEIARANDSDIVHLDGLEHFRLRDRFISLVRPGVVLSIDRRRGGRGAALRSETKSFFVLVLTSGDKKYGVVADELIGEQELVIKPLDSRWVQNEALAGASVLGDGRVVLIMDAEMVFRKAVKYERTKWNGREAYAG